MIEGQLIYNIITIHHILWHRIIINDSSWGPQQRINVYYEIWNGFYLLKFYNAFSPNIFVFIWVAYDNYFGHRFYFDSTRMSVISYYTRLKIKIGTFD